MEPSGVLAWGYGPSTDEVPAFEVLHQWLRRSEADEHRRVEAAAETRLRRTFFDVPRRWCIDRCDWHLGLLQGFDDGREGLANLAGETETCATSKRSASDKPDHSNSRLVTEDGVNNVVGSLQRLGEIIDERNIKILELLG